MKYRSKITGQMVIMISENAAGMCNITLGITLVVYKYEGEVFSYPYVMKRSEFHKKHEKV